MRETVTYEYIFYTSITAVNLNLLNDVYSYA